MTNKLLLTVGKIGRTTDKAYRYITNSDYRFLINSSLGLYNSMPDDLYLKKRFKAIMGYNLDLCNPKTFNEKLQWLKINDRRDVYTSMVDKYEVKKYVGRIIGEQYIIPTIAIWNKAEEIDFSILPQKFVMKCTHDSGGIFLCKNKRLIDVESVKRFFKKRLKYNFFYKGREWPYKNVIPRIIVEEYLVDDNISSSSYLNDYKLQCFNGKFDNIFIAEGRFSKRGVQYHYFDREWNHLPYSKKENRNESLLYLKPNNLTMMIELAERLSTNIPQLRVDFYEVNNKIYFGELTFFSQSGFDTDLTEEADLLLGRKLTLPYKF